MIVFIVTILLAIPILVDHNLTPMAREKEQKQPVSVAYPEVSPGFLYFVSKDPCQGSILEAVPNLWWLLWWMPIGPKINPTMVNPQHDPIKNPLKLQNCDS